MDDAVDASELVFALVDIEGHVEQLAAAAFGGLAAATPAGDQALPGRLGQASQTLFSLPVDDELIMALAVPDLTLETKRARAVLPHEVAFSDAVFNVAAATALVSGLADGDGFLIRVGMQDKLHQDARAELVPASLDVLAAARDAGAYGAAWSGAGPTMLGICGDEDAADDVAYAMTGAFEGAGIESEALVLKIDTLGCVTTELDGDDVALPEPAATPDDPSEARDGDDT